MALINCPECNREISDKVVSCPHCGFPISPSNGIPTTNNVTYNIILQGIFGNKLEIIKCVKNVINIDLSKSMELVDNTPSILMKNVAFSEATKIQQQLERIGAKIHLEPYSNAQNDSLITQKLKIDILSCPRCGSTSITTGHRGFSIISGFLGSNKTINRCGKCGHSWQPK